METIKLECGYVLKFEIGLDGGGSKHYPDFIKAISSTNRKYSRAHEWCAGMGIIGFELLGRQLCDHIVFTDIYDVAIKNCIKIAEDNSIQERVTGYVSESLFGIPDNEKWDLVVANPPHAPDKDKFIQILTHTATVNGYKHTEQQLADALRITLDQDFESHKNFFQNLNKHLLDDADVFISEVVDSDIFEKLATDNGLKLMGYHSAPKLEGGSGCKIFHFRKI